MTFNITETFGKLAKVVEHTAEGVKHAIDLIQSGADIDDIIIDGAVDIAKSFSDRMREHKEKHQ